jgi:hypothetical protein
MSAEIIKFPEMPGINDRRERRRKEAVDYFREQLAERFGQVAADKMAVVLRKALEAGSFGRRFAQTPPGRGTTPPGKA